MTYNPKWANFPQNKAERGNGKEIFSEHYKKHSYLQLSFDFTDLLISGKLTKNEARLLLTIYKIQRSFYYDSVLIGRDFVQNMRMKPNEIMKLVDALIDKGVIVKFDNDGTISINFNNDEWKI